MELAGGGSGFREGTRAAAVVALASSGDATGTLNAVDRKG